jgi:8-oxo-dGTP pyrophosphatase MutT (NUDIX family)
MGFQDSYRMSVHAVITDPMQRVLLLKATYGDFGLGLPGGAVDPGETVLDTLARECREELGVAVGVGPLTGIYLHTRFNSHALLFRCFLPETAAIVLSSEHSEWRYAALEELPAVQRQRVEDCLGFDGSLRCAVF